MTAHIYDIITLTHGKERGYSWTNHTNYLTKAVRTRCELAWKIIGCALLLVCAAAGTLHVASGTGGRLIYGDLC